MRLGVRVLHGRPHHPQTQGKEERFHRTFKAEVVSGRGFRDLPDCQRAFDDWRPRYNHERPHEALGMATPAQRYRPSSRPFPEVLPPIEYAPGDQVRKVDGDGFISFKNRPRRISKALRGEPVALRPTNEDGVFAVHYCAHASATSTSRRRRARPVDLWTTLRVAHRVHRRNSNSKPSLRDGKMCPPCLPTAVHLVSGPNTPPQGGRETDRYSS